MIRHIIVSTFFVVLLLTPVITQAQEDAVQNVPCVDWDMTAAAYNDAWAAWNSPLCYTFTYNYTLDELIRGQSSQRFVKEGAPVDNIVSYREIDSLDAFWNMIPRECLQDCPTSGAHKCTIEYATSDDGTFTYPSFIEIDSDSSISSDTSIYHIFNVSSLECSEIQDTTVDDFANEPCINWETTAAAYEEAVAQWEAPSCYAYTYTVFGEFTNVTIPMTVHHGTATPNEGDPNLQTLDDFWNLIPRLCLENCPSSGAHSCDIEYTTSDDNNGIIIYPTYLFIDQHSKFIGLGGDELAYLIEDVRTIPCPDEEEEMGDDDDKKEKKKKTKKTKNSLRTTNPNKSQGKKGNP